MMPRSLPALTSRCIYFHKNVQVRWLTRVWPGRISWQKLRGPIGTTQTTWAPGCDYLHSSLAYLSRPYFPAPHSNQHFLLDVFLEPPAGFQAPGSSMHGFTGHCTIMSISNSLTCSRLSSAKPDQGLCTVLTANIQLQHTGGTQ